jgi:spore maturation protein CgeB
MRVLFLNPEQYVDFENEPSNYQVRLPALNSGMISEHVDFVYQRIFRKSGAAAMNEAALKAQHDFRPDIVINSLCWWQECIDWQTLAAMRLAGSKVISIYWDTWINALPHETEIFLNSDYILVFDSLSSYFKYRLLGEQRGNSDKVIFSPIGVFTDTIRPIKIKKDIDVLMLGSGEGQRADLIFYLKKELANKNVNFQHIGGLVDDTRANKNDAGNWIDWDSYAKTINRSKICLSSQTQSDRKQIKGKIFDFFASQSFCLTDNNPELKTFVPDHCLAYFKDAEHCLSQIQHYLEKENDRKDTAMSGYQWLTETYRYQDFWQNTFNVALGTSKKINQLPGVEEAYQNFKDQQDLVIRLQTSVINQLSQMVNAGEKITRLPVRAEGSYKGLNILNVDKRFIIVADNLDIDFVEMDGEIYAISPESGILKLRDQEAMISQQTHIIKLNSIGQAKKAIDIISVK